MNSPHARRQSATVFSDGLRSKIKSVIDPYPYRRYQNTHRCIFIHIPKNAGTSIIHALGGNTNYRDHIDYLVYLSANRFKFQTYFKFAVVRNPWDRVASTFEYLARGGNQKKDLYFKTTFHNQGIDFRRFLLDYLTPQRMHEHPLFRPQFPYIFEANGKVAVDYICRFENLKADFDYVKSRLKKAKKLKVINRIQNKKDYRSYYDNASDLVDRVYDLYSEDAVRFKYDFDPSQAYLEFNIDTARTIP